MVEAASGLTQGRVVKLGGAHEDVAESDKVWHADRNHLELLGTCRCVSRKRAPGHSSKSSIYFGFHFSKAPGPL